MTRVFAAILLASCVLVYGLEMSGRWDQTLGDANDEAAVVVIALSVGVAVSGAGAVLTAILSLLRASRPSISFGLPATTRGFHSRRPHIPLFAASPPLALRI